MKRLLLILLLAILPVAPQAASFASHGDSYAIRGARVHTLTGPPLENATVLVRAGRIEAVGTDLAIPKGATVIEAKGLEVYPGFFDSVSQLGLVEIESISATIDTNEVVPFNPQLMASSAINPQSEHIPVTRANGVTHALSAPSISGGTVIGGQAAVINLSGRIIDEMLVKKSAAMVLNWPTLQTGSFDFSTFQFRQRPFSEVKQDYEKNIQQIADLLAKARHYQQATEKSNNYQRDLSLEALIPVVKGELPLLIIANSDRAIRDAVEFSEKQKIRIIIGGGAQAWKVKELLRDKKIPVLLRPTQSTPTEEDEPYDKPYSNPGELHAAGVKIAFATFNSPDSRTLPQEAGQAVPFGLPREEAIRAITINPAEIFGLSDRLGTIEKGKIANLVVTDADPLEIRSKIKYVFIDGKPVSLENRHTRLYEQFRKKQ